MITDLRIQNIGIIEEVTLEMSPGFTVLTGETGAGKTMILTAFQMVCGEKIDSNMIRTNEKNAIIEAFIKVPADKEIKNRLEELDIEIEDDGMQLSRTISREVRGKIVLGSRSIPSSALEEIMSTSVTIHGQGDQIQLNKSSYQRQLLDQFCGVPHEKVLQDYLLEYQNYLALKKTLEDLLQNDKANNLRQIQLQEALQELSDAQLEVDEEITLNERINMINNSEDIFESLAEADNVFNGGEINSENSIAAQIAKARKSLEISSGKSERLASLRDQVSSLEQDINALARDINRDLAALDRDPLVIEKLENRRALLKKILVKYGPSTRDALANIEKFKTEIALVQDIPAAIIKYKELIKVSLVKLSKTGQKIHDQRKKSSFEVSKAIETELKQLSMPNARFVIEISNTVADSGLKIEVEKKSAQYQFDSYGVDQISFSFSANPGQDLKPLSKVASGGEMSRIMLAIELVFSKNVSPRTMIFDEVDAGIGGAAAIEVGKRLKSLAKQHQIVVVTHLPQVAAFADKHLKVEKSASGNVTTSSVSDLNTEQRVTEIARMMAGLQESSSALEHARELLEMSQA
jgi:DNA repair protein RecN (Recombination protein N)